MTFRTTRRIRFHDTDRAGMVFHGAFVTYFQDAFEDLLLATGHPEREAEQRLGVRLPVVHLEVDFRAHPKGDLLSLAIPELSFGRTSLRYRIDTYDEDNDLCAQATIVRVCIDGDGEATPVPDALRNALGKMV